MQKDQKAKEDKTMMTTKQGKDAVEEIMTRQRNVK